MDEGGTLSDWQKHSGNLEADFLSQILQHDAALMFSVSTTKQNKQQQQQKANTSNSPAVAEFKCPRWSSRCMTCLQQQDAKDIKESDEVSDGQGHLKKIISHIDTDPSVLAKGIMRAVNAYCSSVTAICKSYKGVSSCSMVDFASAAKEEEVALQHVCKSTDLARGYSPGWTKWTRKLKSRNLLQMGCGPKGQVGKGAPDVIVLTLPRAPGNSPSTEHQRVQTSSTVEILHSSEDPSVLADVREVVSACGRQTKPKVYGLRAIQNMEEKGERKAKQFCKEMSLSILGFQFPLVYFSNLELKAQVQASHYNKHGGAGAMPYSYRQILTLHRAKPDDDVIIPKMLITTPGKIMQQIGEPLCQQNCTGGTFHQGDADADTYTCTAASKENLGKEMGLADLSDQQSGDTSQQGQSLQEKAVRHKNKLQRKETTQKSALLITSKRLKNKDLKMGRGMGKLDEHAQSMLLAAENADRTCIVMPLLLFQDHSHPGWGEEPAWNTRSARGQTKARRKANKTVSCRGNMWGNRKPWEIINTKATALPGAPPPRQFPANLQLLCLSSSVMKTTYPLAHAGNREEGGFLLKLLCTCRTAVSLAWVLRYLDIFLHQGISLAQFLNQHQSKSSGLLLPVTVGSASL
ncbi:hypothetical protein Anapl_08706 [Anas platyrhynchos]|uniref:Uncharacterized protein n=1 Tax=Anas platyrhynchos TaxID=8839 RepID=R0LJ86_ANAPL|nr:hypothetical protein Anapl_08706 [Anas platyrhynchos]